MKKVIFPLLGAMYLGLTTMGNAVYRFLYDEDTKQGVFIEICRPWERRQSQYSYKNMSR